MHSYKDARLSLCCTASSTHLDRSPQRVEVKGYLFWSSCPRSTAAVHVRYIPIISRKHILNQEYGMYGNCIHWLEPNSIQRAESIQKLQTVEAACSEFSPRCDVASTAVSDDVVQIIVAKKTYISYNDCAVIYHALP